MPPSGHLMQIYRWLLDLSNEDVLQKLLQNCSEVIFSSPPRLKQDNLTKCILKVIVLMAAVVTEDDHE